MKLFIFFSALINIASIFGILCVLLIKLNEKKLTDYLFILFNLFGLIWQVSLILVLFTVQSETNAILFQKIIEYSSIFTALSLYWFLLIFGRIHNKYLLIIGTLATLLLLITSIFIPISGIPRQMLYFNHWASQGPLFFPYFDLLSCLYFVPLVLLGHAYAKRNTRELLILVIGLIICIVGGFTNWFLWFDIMVPPFGIITLTIYAGMFFYAILKHDLMDISVVISRSASILIVGIFYGLLFGLGLLLPNVFWLKQGYFAVLFLFTGLTFNRARLLLQTGVDRKFIKGYYKTETVMLKVTDYLLDVDSLETLYTTVKGKVFDFLEPKFVTIFLKDEIQAQQNKDPLLPIWQATQSSLVEYQEAKVAIPLFLDKDLHVLIFLGPRASEAKYTPRDIKPIENIRKQLMIQLAVIENTRAKVLEQEADKLRDLNKQLEVAMHDLKVAQDKLIEEEQMSAMGNLAGEVAHDIRNPLSSMNRLLQYLLENGVIAESETVLIELFKSGASDEKQGNQIKKLLSNNLEIKQTFMEIVDINHKLRKIANDFLEYSKTSQDIPTEKLAIQPLVEKIVSDYRDTLKEKGITLESNIVSTQHVFMFPQQIERIARNIIDNAIKALEEKATGTDRILNIKLWDEGGKINLSIEDTGIGMDEDHLSKIFKPFYTKRKNLQGTGLGLAIVKKIIDESGGSISVSSTLGQGTVFTLMFQTVV